MSRAASSASADDVGAPEKVVLVHPMGWGVDFWQPVLDAAGDPDLIDAVVLPGPLPAGGDFTLDAALERIEDAAERAGAPVVLAGVSLGARLAVRFAVERPGAVSRLVISGIGLGSGSAVQRLVYRFLPASTITAMSPSNTRAAGLQQLASLRDLDTVGDLARLRTPVTVVCAVDDREYFSQSRRAAEAVGQPLVEIDRGGHFWPTTRPELFLDIVNGSASR